MIDFNPDPAHLELADATAAFVREVVVPYERDERWTPHGPTEDLRSELIEQARGAGLLSPHVDRSLGGHGLSHLGRALVFEEAGWSMLGPVALNINAPDEGNAHLLAHVADDEQKEMWLAPLADGRIRTAFAMTEPSPGAGSDPGLLATVATPTSAGYRINGKKWLITGARGASVFIVMARDPDAGGATMFLVPAGADGLSIDRDLETIDSSFVGGHAELTFEDVQVPNSAVLGEVGAGFRNAQVRLAPARLTHCMRWLGAARRAHAEAAAYANDRTAFGRHLGDHEGVGFMLADNEMDLRTARLHIWHTAWLLDAGERAGEASSIAKTVCSEAIWRIVDRSVQILGGRGLTRDTPVARIFMDVRAFRIYDGPSEVHRWSIARQTMRRAAAASAELLDPPG